MLHVSRLFVLGAAVASFGATAGTADARATTSPTCSTSVLRASLHGRDAAAGHRYFRLTLTNRGTTSCGVQGFPGVSVLDRAGHRIGRPAGRTGAHGTRHVLRPGRSISATLDDTSGPVCGDRGPTRSAALRIFPPDQRAALRIRTTEVGVCGRVTLHVGAFGEDPAG